MIDSRDALISWPAFALAVLALLTPACSDDGQSDTSTGATDGDTGNGDGDTGDTGDGDGDTGDGDGDALSLTILHVNALKVHAGDAVTGTLYYSLFEGEADAQLMNEVCFDAFAPGNHEFDHGDAGATSKGANTRSGWSTSSRRRSTIT
jgi:5'-nucleotidase